MITEADEAHLEFQKHVITYSNCQSTVHITGTIIALRSKTKHNRSVVHNVNQSR